MIMASLDWIREKIGRHYPDSAILEIRPIPRGLAFEVALVVFHSEEQLIFKGQRNCVIPYEGYQNYARYLKAEIAFYEQLASADVPVPSIHHSELNYGENGISYLIMDCMPGIPLDTLIRSVSCDLLPSFLRIMGETLAIIHAIEPPYPWRPDSRSQLSWNERFRERLTRRLEPHLKASVLDAREYDRFLAAAAPLPSAPNRLLHMDFRFENLLGTVTGGVPRITGVIDGANSIAGDVAYGFARMSGGKHVNSHLLEAYEADRGPVHLDTLAYRLYELETAALLAGILDQEGARTRLQRAKGDLVQVL